MSKLQGYKRIIQEDFDEKERPLVGKLGYSLNPTLEDILNVLNKNISIDDNLNITKKDLTITVDGNGVPITTSNLKTDLASNCVGIQVIRASNLTNTALSPTSTPFITFTETNGVLNIRKITNLQANHKYQLKLILYV